MRVLHVEDNQIDADLAQRRIARIAADIELVNAETLADARRCLADGSHYDAVLIDLRLPDGSGLELLGEIRLHRLPLAIVMLTGSGDQEAAVAALQAGADNYLTKDLATLDRLPAVLRDALKRYHEAVSRSSRPLRVLYAEPHQTDIDLTVRHLARYAPHIRITAVGQTEQVLARLPLSPDLPSQFDVVLLDYRLPGADALEVVKVLRGERGLDIPIVIISGYGSEEIAARAFHLGVDDYVAKHPGYLHILPPTLEKVHHQVELERERRNLRAATERLRYVLAESPVILFTLSLRGEHPVATWISGNILRLLGYTEEEALAPGWWIAHLHPHDAEHAIAANRKLLHSGHYTNEYRFFDKAGQTRWIHSELSVIGDGDQPPLEAMGAWRDISAARLNEQIQATRISVLDGLVENQPLNTILNRITASLEAIKPDMRVSILVRDPRDGRLYTGSAPSLPDFFTDVVNGLMPEVGQGACGTAAALGETVIVEDIRTHPYWAQYRQVTERAGLRACWSTPFKDASDQVTGTFGIYYTSPCTPSRDEINLIGEFARIAGLAVERVRAQTVLLQSAAVFDSSSEGVLITDLTPSIVQVNRAYCELSGYGEAELLGRNPNILRSGHHDPMFYAALWRSVRQTGGWRGEIWNRRKNGEVFPQLLTISTVYNQAGNPTHYAGVLTDISQIKQSEERLKHLSHFDPLTDLPNRVLLQYRLEHALEMAGRSQQRVAVLFIDLDHFKHINDGLGHPVGDLVLGMLARRMQLRLREGDTLGRLGGDEFMVLLENVVDPGEAGDVANELLQMMQEPLRLPDERDVYVGASIGISIYPDDARAVTELIQYAESAMYQAKESSRNTFRYYTASLTSTVNARFELDSRMRRAMAQDEFIVYYQPQIDIQSGKVVGCEALLRWNDPVEGMISPARFIPLAEDNGLIVALGEWVLRVACAQAVAWERAGLPLATMSVNLSGRQLHDAMIVQKVAAVLHETGIRPGQLKLELTESSIMGQAQEAIDLLGSLRALGLELAIDDFGTGYSSLAYLSCFPIDELKIDQSFVSKIPHDQNGMEIAATVIAMARNLHLKVVAEGVESVAQREFLQQHGCHSYQGFLFSPAVPPERFFELARAQNAMPEQRAARHVPDEV